MSKEHDILKSLLLKEELEQLDVIKQKLLSEEQFTKEVAKVLAAALKRAQAQDKNLERALSRPIKEGVKRAFVDSKQSIIDSMLPIMGQLIRKTVTNSIKQFVSDINRILEQRFSIKYIKWRWKAFRTGTSLAQIVFQNTVHYQVSEIFLINKENGLLIQHVGTDEMLKDNHAISGMLTAIQDFVGDSLNETDSQLESIEIKGKQLLFAFGPKAYLAAIVMGSPTERLKEKLQQLIENVHAQFSDELSVEAQYHDLPELNDFLRTHLVTKSLSPETKKINWIPWVLMMTLIIAYIGYNSYKNSVAYDKVLSAAESIDGFVLQDIQKIDAGYKVIGLLDPLADVSKLQKENITLSTKAFISLDTHIIKKRIDKVLAGHPEISSHLQHQTVNLKGRVSQHEYAKLLSDIEKIPGVEKIENRLVIDNQAEVEAFINQYPQFSKNSVYVIQEQKLKLSGQATQNELKQFKSAFKARFPQLFIKEANINIETSSQALIQIINTTRINLADFNNMNLQDANWLKVINSLQKLSKRGVKIQLQIIGESDCYGTNSNAFSKRRALLVKQALLDHKFEENLIKTEINSCTKYLKHKDVSLLGVSFKIK